MAGFPATAWIWWTAGVIVGLLAIWRLYRSLLHDRSRGRRRCPKCWYDMSGTDSLTCSECGRTFKRERRLFKTRRRWRWAFVSIVLLLVSAAGMLTPKVQRDGWVESMPTTVLIASLPWLPPHSDMPFFEFYYWWNKDPSISQQLRKQLDIRATEDRLADWQWRWLIGKCIRGDADRRPPLRDWGDQYGRFLHLAHRHGRLGQEPLSEELQRLRCAFTLRTRERWPCDIPLRVEGWTTAIWGQEASGNTRFRLLTPRGHVGTHFQWASGIHLNIDLSYFHEDTMNVGVPPAGAEWVDFEVTLDSDPTYRNLIRVPVQIEGSIDDYLTSVRADEIEADLGRITTARLIGRLETVDLPARPLVAACKALAGTTVAIRLEVRDPEAVVQATGRAWWPPDEGPTLNRTGTIRIPIEWGSGTPERLDPSESWTLTIVGDPEVALSDFEATRYWAAEVEIPLAIPER